MKYQIGEQVKFQRGVEPVKVERVIDRFRSFFVLFKNYIVLAPPYNYVCEERELERLTYFDSLEELLNSKTT